MTVLTDVLKMYRGEKKAWEGILTDAVGDVVDITGAAIYFTVRLKYPAAALVADTDANVLFKKTVGAGITLSNPTQGKFEILVDKADTNSLEIGATGKGYLYGLEIVEDGETEPRTLAGGKFTVLSDVVRGI